MVLRGIMSYFSIESEEKLASSNKEEPGKTLAGRTRCFK